MRINPPSPLQSGPGSAGGLVHSDKIGGPDPLGVVPIPQFVVIIAGEYDPGRPSVADPDEGSVPFYSQQGPHRCRRIPGCAFGKFQAG